MTFVQELSEEDQRGVAEQLTEEELAIFDILTKPTPDLPPKEKKEVKLVARKLLQTLKQAKLVLDWRKKLRTRADVFATVKTVLDDLPRIYTPGLVPGEVRLGLPARLRRLPGRGAEHLRRGVRFPPPAAPAPTSPSFCALDCARRPGPR